MGKMKELLDQRLEENKWDMYQLLKDMVSYHNVPGMTELNLRLLEFADYQLEARRIIEKIEKEK